MPIVFVHGVAQRNENAFAGLQVFLDTYVARAVNPKRPANVKSYSAYWGPLGVSFAWEGLSRPRTAITHQGAADETDSAATAAVLGRLVPLRAADVQPARPAASSELAGGVREDEVPSLDGIPRAERGELLINTLLAGAIPLDDPQRATAVGSTAMYSMLDASIAREIVALDAAAQAVHDDDLDAVLADAALRALDVASQGGGIGSRFTDLKLRTQEALSRTAGSGAFLASRLLEELRGPFNDVVTLFVGDVFIYLANRLASDAASTTQLQPDAAAIQRRTAKPGSIPHEVLRVIKRAVDERADSDEPLVILTHSMGGQIVYDIVSFLPAEACRRKAERLRRDPRRLLGPPPRRRSRIVRGDENVSRRAARSSRGRRVAASATSGRRHARRMVERLGPQRLHQLHRRADLRRRAG